MIDRDERCDMCGAYDIHRLCKKCVKDFPTNDKEKIFIATDEAHFGNIARPETQIELEDRHERILDDIDNLETEAKEIEKKLEELKK